MHNKAATFNEASSNKEKLKGGFSLRISKNLSIDKKIEKYAQDSMVFHLHKNRNFLRKIELQEKEENAKRENEEKFRNLVL